MPARTSATLETRWRGDRGGRAIWRRIILRCCALLALAALLSACETLQFYRQAAAGQLGIVLRRESTRHLIADPATDAQLRAHLIVAGDILRFARERLRLPTKGEFSSYVDVGGKYVVWNVFATPEFSTQPVQWCYPIIGCASYRGYFHDRDARRLATRLSVGGHDVAVGGVVAYSTLGWFDDPLLSTYVDWEPTELAGLLFHELAHSKLFIKGDTAFNEGFATFVEREGVREWLNARGEAAEIGRAEDRWRRSERLVQMMLSWRTQLSTLYRQSLNSMARRMLKGEMMTEIDRCLRENQEVLGKSSVNRLLHVPMNNAQLVPFAAYHDYVPGFAALFEESEGDWETFFRRAQTLGRMKPAEREAALRRPAKEVQAGAPAVHCRTLTYGTEP